MAERVGNGGTNSLGEFNESMNGLEVNKLELEA